MKSHHSISTTHLSNSRRMSPRRMDRVPTYSLRHLQSYCQLKGTKMPVKSLFIETVNIMLMVVHREI